jgi:hypothetical protein
MMIVFAGFYNIVHVMTYESRLMVSVQKKRLFSKNCLQRFTIDTMLAVVAVCNDSGDYHQKCHGFGFRLASVKIHLTIH